MRTPSTAPAALMPLRIRPPGRHWPNSSSPSDPVRASLCLRRTITCSASTSSAACSPGQQASQKGVQVVVADAAAARQQLLAMASPPAMLMYSRGAPSSLSATPMEIPGRCSSCLRGGRSLVSAQRWSASVTLPALCPSTRAQKVVAAAMSVRIACRATATCGCLENFVCVTPSLGSGRYVRAHLMQPGHPSDLRRVLLPPLATAVYCVSRQISYIS